MTFLFIQDLRNNSWGDRHNGKETHSLSHELASTCYAEVHKWKNMTYLFMLRTQVFLDLHWMWMQLFLTLWLTLHVPFCDCRLDRCDLGRWRFQLLQDGCRGQVRSLPRTVARPWQAASAQGGERELGQVPYQQQLGSHRQQKQGQFAPHASDRQKAGYFLQKAEDILSCQFTGGGLT